MRNFALLILTLAVMSACSIEEERESVAITFKGVNETLLRTTYTNAEAEVRITDFKLSFRDIEFKEDESDLDTNEVQFRGPFDVDLMNENEALSQTIGTTDIPDGIYKVIRFKLHKSKDRMQTHPLYDRSLFLAGTIDGIPFEFWHDASENFDIENMTGILVSNNSVNIGVEFNIDQFLNSLHNIDLADAQDENDNGLIEINPDDDDDNGDIADKLKENIKEAADLIKL